MSLSLDDSLKTGRLTFFAMFKPLATLLVLLSFVRFLFYWRAQPLFDSVPVEDLLKAFGMGFRFDLLLLGFVMIPVVIFLTAISWFCLWSKRVRQVLKVYFIATWIGIVTLEFFDLRFFATAGRHLTIFDQGFSPFAVGGVFDVLILVFIGVAGVGSFLVLDWPNTVKIGRVEPVSRRIVTTLVPIILVALAARGTVTAHHLEKEHSEVSEHPVVNHLVVNSPWAYSKKPTEN